jgi:hypothetical protein
MKTESDCEWIAGLVELVASAPNGAAENSLGRAAVETVGYSLSSLHDWNRQRRKQISKFVRLGSLKSA